MNFKINHLPKNETNNFQRAMKTAPLTAITIALLAIPIYANAATIKYSCEGAACPQSTPTGTFDMSWDANANIYIFNLNNLPDYAETYVILYLENTGSAADTALYNYTTDGAISVEGPKKNSWLPVGKEIRIKVTKGTSVEASVTFSLTQEGAGSNYRMVGPTIEALPPLLGKCDIDKHPVGFQKYEMVNYVALDGTARKVVISQNNHMYYYGKGTAKFVNDDPKQKWINLNPTEIFCY